MCKLRNQCVYFRKSYRLLAVGQICIITEDGPITPGKRHSQSLPQVFWTTNKTRSTTSKRINQCLFTFTLAHHAITINKTTRVSKREGSTTSLDEFVPTKLQWLVTIGRVNLGVSNYYINAKLLVFESLWIGVRNENWGKWLSATVKMKNFIL